MQLVTRAQWGARPPKSQTPLVLAVQQGTAVHYSAADADEQADHANCAGRVRGIQTYHVDHNGWADIAYSYLTCKHGFVFEGRGRGVRTAAQGTTSGNDAYHAVCFLGDDSAGRDDVTDPGRAAIRQAVEHCNSWAGVWQVRPHSDFHSTACPGDDLRAWLAAGMPVDTAQPEEDWMPLSDADKAFFRELDAARHADMITLLRGESHASTAKLLAALEANGMSLEEANEHLAALEAALAPPATGGGG